MAWEEGISNLAQARIASRETGKEVLRLKRDGYNTQEIAVALSIPEKRVSTLFRNALANYLAPDVQSIRAEEACKLDAMERAIAKKVEGGNLPAVAAALKIMERRARLLGLDVKEASTEKQEAKILDVTVWAAAAAESAAGDLAAEAAQADSEDGPGQALEDGAVPPSGEGVDE